MNECSGSKRGHEFTIIGSPRSAMTWYYCPLCGNKKPRGEGLFYTPKTNDNKEVI
jgi:hypothetical protein